MVVGRGLRLFLGVLFAALVLPTAASAQSPNRPDPDSPAGVEYELPLDRARERAAGDDGPRRGGKGGPVGSAPLFGEGIGPSGGGGSGGADGDPSSGVGGSADGSDTGDASSSSGVGSGPGDSSRGGGGSASQGGADSKGGNAPRVTAATTTADANTGGSGLGPTAAIVAAVLLAAGALGLLLRRTMRAG